MLVSVIRGNKGEKLENDEMENNRLIRMKKKPESNDNYKKENWGAVDKKDSEFNQHQIT